MRTRREGERRDEGRLTSRSRSHCQHDTRLPLFPAYRADNNPRLQRRRVIAATPGPSPSRPHLTYLSYPYPYRVPPTTDQAVNAGQSFALIAGFLHLPNPSYHPHSSANYPPTLLLFPFCIVPLDPMFDSCQILLPLQKMPHHW